jgi:hypothetical protein
MNRARACALGLVASAGLACAAGVAHAQSAAPDPAAPPQPAATVRDPDFGVVARHFGLERDVEMFQWQRRGEGYRRTWSSEALDSSGFAPGHDNPPMPLQGRRWIASEVRVDGVPLAPGVLPALGEWKPFRPSFNALPGNLAATFQPQGDGLGTAEDPMAPEVGDLRIHWRELRLPPLGDRIVLEAARWHLKAVREPMLAADAAVAAGTGDADAAPRVPARDRLVAVVVAALLLVLVAGFGAARFLRRRARGQRPR